MPQGYEEGIVQRWVSKVIEEYGSKNNRKSFDEQKEIIPNAEKVICQSTSPFLILFILQVTIMKIYLNSLPLAI